LGRNHRDNELVEIRKFSRPLSRFFNLKLELDCCL